MDYALVLSRANQGLDAPTVRVEVHLSAGLPAFTVVGMPETAVRESRDRVRSALLNCHFEFPDGRITVNLAPADLPKGGGRFDLPIALGILCASGQLPAHTLRDSECLGELALDGALRHVRGAVAATMAATAAGRRIIVPTDSLPACAAVPDSRLLAAPDLLELCALLRGKAEEKPRPRPRPAAAPQSTDLAEVVGQETARRALEVAAAGAHNLLLVGPPGTGKSLIASCLPGILPAPASEERTTVAALHDLQGADYDGVGRPFRCPHHSASAAALVGGGSVPRPGEISLAHGGVLFLDELAEFSRHTLDMLREPLETGSIALARSSCVIRYPARFQLVAAMNPCPCGYAGDRERACRCSAAQRRAYATRLSGPLLDRMDIQVRVEREDTAQLLRGSTGESSAAVATRVRAARGRQLQRQSVSNALLGGSALLEVCSLGRAERALLESAAQSMQLSARAVHRTLRVARTIADLAAEQPVGSAALAQALGYRSTLATPQ